MKPNVPLFDLLVFSLPLGFCGSLKDGFEVAYRESFARATNDPGWGESGAAYMRGHFRHTLTNEAFRIAAVMHGLKVELEVAETESTDFTVVTVGDLAISAAHTISANTLPERAKYRRQFSEIYTLGPQLSLFPYKTEPKSSDSRYVILTHGEARGDKSKMGFLEFAFPDPACKAWVDHFSLDEVIAEQTRRFVGETDTRAAIQKDEPQLKKHDAQKDGDE